MAYKDFTNYRYNPVYTIVGDDKSHFHEKYNLSILYANEGKLFNMKRSYGEMSQLYYIYQLYKNGTLSSKYVGLNHYRRYFNFLDNIPDLDDIFKNYDLILVNAVLKEEGLRNNYCKYHICEKYDEAMDIIKYNKSEYYATALKINDIKGIYFCNMFIMKKEDFMKYCEFIFDILFELDRRNNFKTDKDVLNYVKQIFKKKKEYEFQSRFHGFLSERLSNIFYHHNFKRIKIFSFSSVKARNSYCIKEKRIYKPPEALLISLIINIIVLFIFFCNNLFLK